MEDACAPPWDDLIYCKAFDAIVEAAKSEKPNDEIENFMSRCLKETAASKLFDDPIAEGEEDASSEYTDIEDESAFNYYNGRDGLKPTVIYSALNVKPRKGEYPPFINLDEFVEVEKGVIGLSSKISVPRLSEGSVRMTDTQDETEQSSTILASLPVDLKAVDNSKSSIHESDWLSRLPNLSSLGHKMYKQSLMTASQSNPSVRQAEQASHLPTLPNHLAQRLCEETAGISYETLESLAAFCCACYSKIIFESAWRTASAPSDAEKASPKKAM